MLQRLQKVRQTLGRFAMASGFSFLSILGGTVALHQGVGLSQELAYGLVLSIVFVVNFLLLRNWVYAEISHHGVAWRQLLHTAAASLVFRGVEYGGFLALHTWIGVHYVLAIAAVTAVVFGAKFFYYRNAVFGAGQDGEGSPVGGGRDPRLRTRAER